MLYALCSMRFYIWKVFFVQIVTISIPFNRPDGDAIAISEPVRGRQILDAIRDTDGEILIVAEKEIKAALREMGRKGHFIEPTSAATIAGLKKYLRKKRRRETVVSTFTGTGLKSVGKIL